jgi:hypothetical protein
VAKACFVVKVATKESNIFFILKLTKINNLWDFFNKRTHII